MGEGRGVYRVLVGRPEGKRPLGKPRRRWEDNIKMDLVPAQSWCLLVCSPNSPSHEHAPYCLLLKISSIFIFSMCLENLEVFT
jgi:hypothetical protein